MFKQYSKAGVGMYSSLATGLLLSFGFDVTQSDVDTIILTVVNFFSLLLWAYGQVDRQDTIFGLKRKDVVE